MLHRALQDPQRGLAIPALAGEDLEYLAFVINGASRITSGELLKYQKGLCISGS
jgi:hypothetical protein